MLNGNILCVMTKTKFFDSICEIVTDKIYLSENLDELNKEVSTNHWSFGIDYDTAKKIKNKDLKCFLKRLVENRKKQLESNDKKMDLLFYSWFDEQAGNINLNFINLKHEKLPFGSEIDFVKSIDIIIDNFLNSKYLEGIPWREFEGSKDNEKIDFKVKVYKEKILKSTKHNNVYSS